MKSTDPERFQKIASAEIELGFKPKSWTTGFWILAQPQGLLLTEFIYNSRVLCPVLFCITHKT
jgi:hypothetical protein